MKLQHTSYLEGIIKILESGYISPPKRVGLKTWSVDFLFWSIVDNDVQESNSIYGYMNFTKTFPRHFIHPTSNLYGILSKTWIFKGLLLSNYDTLILFSSVMVFVFIVTLGLIPSVVKTKKVQWVPHSSKTL